MKDGSVIALLMCILVVIVNIIAVIIIGVLCRRRRRQRARTAGVLEREPTYHDTQVFGELTYENVGEFRDEGGYEIPIPPPYTYSTPLPGGSGIDYHNVPEAVWREDVGTYLLEIRSDQQNRNFRKDNKDELEQRPDKGDPGKLHPRVELTLALYHASDS